jgi:hypothetical protein
LREREWEGGATEEDHGGKGLSGFEAVGSMGDESDLIVHAFERTVGEAVAEEVEDALEVELDGGGDAAKGAKSRAYCPTDPAPHSEARPARVGAGVCSEEVFLEQVGAEEPAVGFFQMAEAVSVRRV